MGHVWDGDLQEFNHPLPRWWIYLFWITIFFGLTYIALYPGLGSYAGAWHWSSTGQYDAEQKLAQDFQLEQMRIASNERVGKAKAAATGTGETPSVDTDVNGQ